jgi:outer membrane lipoprotein-sorting protein
MLVSNLEEPVKSRTVLKFVLLATASASLTIGLLGTAFAQTTATDVIAKVEAALKGVKDYKLRVTGDAVGNDDRKLALDVEISSIPSLNLTRIKFNKPDELADNFVIIDKDKISNYLFLTNQVTVQSRKGNASIGGVNLDINQFNDPTQAFPKDKINFKPVSEDDTPDGKAWLLEGTPKPGADLEFSSFKAWVIQKDVRVYRLQYFNSKKVLQLDVKIPEYKTNIGLKPATLRAIPKDAEIIKK